MRYLLWTILLVTAVSAKKKKQKCEWSDRPGIYLKNYDRKSKAYPSVEEAKEACEKDSSCGAVGLDLIPYREVPGGPVIHDNTVYLLEGDGPESLLLGARPNRRYKSYIKVECTEEKKGTRNKETKNKKDKKDKKEPKTKRSQRKKMI